MKSIESLQLIRVRPQIGALVLEPSSSALFNAEHLSAHRQRTDLLIEFRKIIEVGHSSLAADSADEAGVLAMHQAISDHRRALETDRVAHHADIGLHMAIAVARAEPDCTDGSADYLRTTL